MGLCCHTEVWGLLSLLWYPRDEFVSPMAEGGLGVAATSPRLTGTLWVLVPVLRAQGLQGGQQPLVEVAVEAEEEGERAQN